jgi:3'-phosphoadenosine 5'-phosphosulfate sulfotransferase (PAPS reductase)/FAD synthetase
MFPVLYNHVMRHYDELFADGLAECVQDDADALLGRYVRLLGERSMCLTPTTVGTWYIWYKDDLRTSPTEYPDPPRSLPTRRRSTGDTMSNLDFTFDTPTVLSFSGGRTSGYMLWRVLQAHGGTLPDHIKVCFANTGLEHSSTYRFIEDCSDRWAVNVHWLEYRNDGNGHSFAEVSACTASRDGRPFTELTNARGYLPNVVARFCTAELKMRTMSRWVKAVLGWDVWTEVVGLRADEPRRVQRIRSDSSTRTVATPLADDGVTEADVLDFWQSHDFDLQLPGGSNMFGNCVGCFLKGRAKLERIAETNPEYLRWWSEREDALGKVFRYDRPKYSTMIHQVTLEGGKLFDDSLPDVDLPCFCAD